MKIGLISGHGAGDCGACGCGFAEADLTIELVKILEDKGCALPVPKGAINNPNSPLPRPPYKDSSSSGHPVVIVCL